MGEPYKFFWKSCQRDFILPREMDAASNAAQEAVASGEGQVFVSRLIKQLEKSGMAHGEAFATARALLMEHMQSDPNTAKVLLNHLRIELDRRLTTAE